MKQENDLELVTTEDLIFELERRFDDLVVLGRAARSDKTESYVAQWKGSAAAALGLCVLFQDRIRHEHAQLRDQT